MVIDGLVCGLPGGIGDGREIGKRQGVSCRHARIPSRLSISSALRSSSSSVVWSRNAFSFARYAGMRAAVFSITDSAFLRYHRLWEAFLRQYMQVGRSQMQRGRGPFLPRGVCQGSNSSCMRFPAMSRFGLAAKKRSGTEPFVPARSVSPSPISTFLYWIAFSLSGEDPGEVPLPTSVG